MYIIYYPPDLSPRVCFRDVGRWTATIHCSLQLNVFEKIWQSVGATK